MTGHQSCLFSVGPTERRTAADRFSMLDVVQAAGRIITKCVKQEQGELGGKVAVGTANMFAVAVVGIPRDE